jgi:RNA polymerase sigma factor (TIGR02999 family)
MTDVTRVLSAIEQGDPAAAEQLLPLVYEELRKLAAAQMAREKPGQTLQPTALVHEAYIRLVDAEEAQHWNSRGHFFAAAAEAMRRILVERIRRKRRLKHGGEHERADVLEITGSGRRKPLGRCARSRCGTGRTETRRPSCSRIGQAPLFRRSDAPGGGNRAGGLDPNC